MHDILTMMDHLKRPRLLTRAAQMGAEHYYRDSHLDRVLGLGSHLRSGPVLIKLMEKEAALNAQRLSQDAAYSLTQHLDLLIAMVGEARILRASQISRARHAAE